MKITITFELEFENAVTEADKMATLHKIDQAVETLKPLEMVKRTVVVYPFHVRGWIFCTGRSVGKSQMVKEIIKKNIKF